ncbi:unnamed protein product, partial [marine sediment metagenome]
PDQKRKANARVNFHNPAGDCTTSAKLAMPPGRSILECLHAKPWLGKHTHVDEPFAMTVSADKPVVPEVTCAEFEMFSRVCPGAMSAVNFYPGPLTNERTWWLGLGRTGGCDDVATNFSQYYHLFNPGPRSVRAVVRFLGFGSKNAERKQPVEIGAGAVVRIDATKVKGLPIDRPFAVRVDGDAPLCAQVFVRASTRGLSFTRSMYSMMGIPMKFSPRR